MGVVFKNTIMFSWFLLINFSLLGQSNSNFKTGVGYGYNFNSNGDFFSGILELDLQYKLSSSFLATFTYGSANSFEFDNYSNITNIYELKMENSIPVKNSFGLNIQYGFTYYNSNVTDIIYRLYTTINDEYVLLENFTSYYQARSFGNIVRIGLKYSFGKSEINLIYGIRYYYDKTIFRGAIINFRYDLF